MGLMYLKAVLNNNNISSVIIDTYAKNMTIPELLDKIKRYNPKYVCISVYSDFIRGTIQLIEALNKYHIIVGGPHITHDKDFINKYPVRTAVINEGENTIAKIMINEESGLIDGGISDLNTLPLPDRNIDYGGYYSGGFIGSEKSTLHTSRGCPYGCIFCSQYNKKVRCHTTDFIERDISYCKQTLKTKHISFTDDNLLLNRDRFMIISQYLKKHNISWSCMARADAIDNDRIEIAKQSNCKGITIGIECGDEHIRNHIVKKNIMDKKIYEAKKICDKHRLDTQFFFMAGFPTETTQDMHKTLKMARKLGCVFFSAAPPVCYQGTEIFNIAVRENKIKKDAWDELALGRTEELPIYYPEPFNRGQFMAFSKNLVYKYYLNVGYILIALTFMVKSKENFKSMLFYFKEFTFHIFKKFVLRRKPVSK